VDQGNGHFWVIGGFAAATVTVAVVSASVSEKGWVSQETAAWVQALGGIAAVSAAGYIANGEARDRTARQKVDDQRHAAAQHALLSSAYGFISQAAEAAFAALQTPNPMMGRRGDDGRLGEVAVALAAFPVQTVENPHAVELIVTARLVIAALRKAWAISLLNEPEIWARSKELADAAEGLRKLL
jgi:hypothetical protein